VNFVVSRSDVNLMLAELRDHHPEALSALWTPLLEALVAASAALDTDASRLDTGHRQTTGLHVPAEHVELFQQWLEQSALRAVTTDPAKAQAFVRIRDSSRR
jgi:hypothetical protein